MNDLTKVHNPLFTQDFGMNIDQFRLLEDSNKKVFEEINKILSKYDIQLESQTEQENGEYVIIRL